jgi:eukaryotic-like serine/threonine-protein kinase
MTQFETGHRLDGFIVDACIHAGGMAHIYRVHCADPARQADFPLIMKVPRMNAGDGAENLLGFEVEERILAVLSGTHAPRFFAAGDIATVPYLVMEYVKGETVQDWLDHAPQRDMTQIAGIGAQIAHAVHWLHEQQVLHLDLKPANVMIAERGGIVLLDFGLSRHLQQPDLLAEDLRTTIGSYAWIAPEQIVGVRNDPRSDLFAIGVILYEMCTGELPFGNPQTKGGLRQRLWMQPRPPRQLNPQTPDWLQEIILCCLAAHADDRYAAAALLAFDLTHPDQVKVGERGRATRGDGFWAFFRRWLGSSDSDFQPSAVPVAALGRVPIVMVAVPHRDASEATLLALRRAAERCLGNRPGARLSCVTVVSHGDANAAGGEVSIHQQMLVYLRNWAETVNVGDHQITCHALEAGDVAQALLAYAESNHVNLIVMGAATHGLQLQRFVATVPVKVAMHAPCTVMLVKD